MAAQHPCKRGKYVSVMQHFSCLPTGRRESQNVAGREGDDVVAEDEMHSVDQATHVVDDDVRW